MKPPHSHDKRRSAERTPTDATPARLPAPPSAAGLVTPAGSHIPAPPALPPRPGRHTDRPSDLSVTHRIERITVERTPAPLPPAPATDADKWFEQVPTNLSGPQPTERASQPPASAVLGLPAPPRRVASPAGDGRPPWLVPVLIAATSLTIGMILGALLFGGDRHQSKGGPCTPADSAKR